MNETFLGLDESLITSGRIPNATVKTGAITEADVEMLRSVPVGAKMSDDDLFAPVFAAFGKIQYYHDGLKTQAGMLADMVKSKLGAAACFPTNGDELMVACMNETCPLVILT